MASSNHAITGSGGSYCCFCSSSVGPQAKVHPQNVDNETWCPRCFVWWRMGMEPGRFNASRSAAVQCQFCGWITVSHGVSVRGAARCFHCNAGGAILLNPTKEQMKEAETFFRAFREKVKTDGGVTLQPS